MLTGPPPLPSTVPECRAVILMLWEEIGRLQARLQEVDSRLAKDSSNDLVERLPSCLNLLHARAVGRRESPDLERNADPGYNPGAWSVLWDSAKRANGALGGGAAIAVGLLTWQVAPEKTVPAWAVLSVALLLVAVIWLLIDAFVSAVRLPAYRPVTTIVTVEKPFAPYLHTKCVIVVGWNTTAVIPVGSSVAISLAREKYELPLGRGTVRRAQTDGRYVVTVDELHAGSEVETQLKNLLEPGSDLGSKIRIGPPQSLQHLSQEPAKGSPAGAAIEQPSDKPMSRPLKGIS